MSHTAQNRLILTLFLNFVFSHGPFNRSCAAGAPTVIF